jgi:hypothetical protein
MQKRLEIVATIFQDHRIWNLKKEAVPDGGIQDDPSVNERY